MYTDFTTTLEREDASDKPSKEYKSKVPLLYQMAETFHKFLKNYSQLITNTIGETTTTI